jgi:hypothetical protein
VGHAFNEWPSSRLFENELRAGPGGVVRGIENLTVGSDQGYSVSNRVTCAGGEISCAKFILHTGNFLAAHITADGMPEVSVDAGAVEFKPGTFVFPTADKDAPLGDFVLLRAQTDIDPADRDNLKLAPGVDAVSWKITVNARDVILKHVLPNTLLIIR